jgi:hypothetical protein
MADYTLNPIRNILDILWYELTLAENGPILDKTRYVIPDDDQSPIFRFPIIPVQQQIVFNNQFVYNGEALPYIVYDHDFSNYGDTDWWICKERLTFTIYATEYGKILQIQQLIIDLFRRFDDSAKDLNRYMNRRIDDADLTEPLLTFPKSSANKNRFEEIEDKFMYYYFNIDQLIEPDPAIAEGGRMAGQIAIDFAYSRKLASDGRFA